MQGSATHILGPWTELPLKELWRCDPKLHLCKVRDCGGVDLKLNFASKLVGDLQKHRFPGFPQTHQINIYLGEVWE